MLRYAKNGPLRAPVCTSAQGTLHAALQWLLCSNTHLKTKSGKAAFYGFHGEMNAAGRLARGAGQSLLHVLMFCCFCSRLSTPITLCVVKAEMKMRMLNAVRIKIRTGEVPGSGLVSKQMAVCWFKGEVCGISGRDGRSEPWVWLSLRWSSTSILSSLLRSRMQPHKVCRVPLFRAGTSFLKYL